MQPVGDDFSIDVASYKGSNGVVIANPNAPTSLALGQGQIAQLLEQNPNGVVLVDEAYIDFASVGSAVKLLDTGEMSAHELQARSHQQLVQVTSSQKKQLQNCCIHREKKYRNLLIVRTFSKSHALAGARVGYAIGHPQLINALRLMRDAFNSYPLDMLAQTAAIAAIRDREYLHTTTKKVVATREKTTTALQFMGYKVLDSQTNFILIETPLACDLYNHLLQNKILARYWSTQKLANYLRVTIGTDPQMEAFLQCVQAFTTDRRKKQT